MMPAADDKSIDKLARGTKQGALHFVTLQLNLPN